MSRVPSSRGESQRVPARPQRCSELCSEACPEACARGPAASSVPCAGGPSLGPSRRAGRALGSESGRHLKRRSSFAATLALRPASAEFEVTAAGTVSACACARCALSPAFLTPRVPALRCSLKRRAVSELPGIRPCRNLWRFSRPARVRRPVQGRPSFWGAALAVQPHLKHAQMPGPTLCKLSA